MKKGLLILTFLISLTSFVQMPAGYTRISKQYEWKPYRGFGPMWFSTQDTTTPAKPIVPPADSVAIISAADLIEFSKALKKDFSYEDYIKMTPEQVVTYLYQFAVIRWNEKKKKKKP